ncbi:MAG: hypothetical protein Q8T08_10005 [Ignavibacteria bacterium]|nr:hypothetical protein [Ignavibacteria bacterium]
MKLKQLIGIAAVGLYMMACTPPPPPPPAINNADDANIKLVKNYVTAVESMDYKAMGDFLDDNYIGIGPSYGDTTNKEMAVRNWRWNLIKLYESIKYNKSKFAPVTITEGDNKGEWVANWAELTIVYKDNMGSVIIWANTNYLVENGKILRSITFYNEADAIRQLYSETSWGKDVQ